MMGRTEKLPISGNVSKKCAYVLKTSTEHPPVGLYCNKPTNSYVSRDDDRNKIRIYETFCPAHKYEVERLDNTESEE